MRPNIVFILSDDQGAWAMGCAGNTELHTPNLDRLASEGIRFSEFFCASPVCSPARASILTGTIPSRHGILDWLSGGNLPSGIREMEGLYGYEKETKPIPYLEGLTAYTDLLAQNGYTCSLCGKWHMGDSMTPQHGFKNWTVMGRGGCDYYHGDVVLDGRLVFPQEYITDFIGEQALEQLETLAADRAPFYLGVHFTAPHSPWDEGNHPKEMLDLYRDCDFESTPDLPLHPNQVNTCPVGVGEARKEVLRGYYAAITAMDRQIGRLLDRLEELGLKEDTLVIFTSDNGMNMGHHGIWGKGNATYPQNMYDSSIKVPFLISWKGHLPEGKECQELCSHYDIFPTLIRLLELEGKVNQKLPGRSLVPWLHQPEHREENAIIILDEYGPVRMIRTEKWKLVQRMENMENELYNLLEDPEEENNLYGAEGYRELGNKLEGRLEDWYGRYGCPDIERMRADCKGAGQFGSVREYEEGRTCFDREPGRVRQDEGGRGKG